MTNDSLGNSVPKSPSYSDKEFFCNRTYNESVKGDLQFWHVCTPGNLTEILNVTEDDFKFAVSNSAISAYESGASVITDAHMENHIHSLLYATRGQCLTYIDRYRYRLRKHLHGEGRIVDLSKFRCDDPILITDLEMMRNEIIYINRNGYVADSRYTPFSYPWGGGSVYFNPSAQVVDGVPYNDILFKEKRELCFRRVSELPVSYMVYDGYIHPSSYVNYRLGQSMFRDAHHYINSLVRNTEAYCAEAERLGDNSAIPREEMYPAVKLICNRDYNVKQPSLLSSEDKLAVARTMHSQFHATNAQIRMILKMTEFEVNSLFPLSSGKLR